MLSGGLGLRLSRPETPALFDEQRRTVTGRSPRRPRARPENRPVTLRESVRRFAGAFGLASSQVRAGGVPLGAKEPPHHGSRGGQNGYEPPDPRALAYPAGRP